MPSIAWIDGQLTALAEARVPVTDRGLLFGDHVFEIVCALGRRLIDGPAHLDRLERSASLLRMPAPPTTIADTIDRVLDRAQLERASLRVIWTRGDGATVRIDPATPGRLIVLAEPWSAPVTAPVRLLTQEIDATGRTGAVVPAAAKSGNYLASVLGLAIAADHACDDVLWIDRGGAVLETATASVAIVDGDGVTFAAGAVLPGVTAARIAALLRADGVAVGAAVVTRARLASAAEVFVTSARRGVVAVGAIDGAARPAGPTTTRAANLYQAWLDGGAVGGGPAATAL